MTTDDDWARLRPLGYYPDERMGAEQALAWIEQNSTLHRSVDILYVVDGYEVSISHDGEPLPGTWRGETLLAAVQSASAASPNAWGQRGHFWPPVHEAPHRCLCCGAPRAAETERQACPHPRALHERIVRLLADAEQLAVDLREARNAAALGEKTELRYACRHIEQAAAVIRKAGK